MQCDGHVNVITFTVKVSDAVMIEHLSDELYRIKNLKVENILKSNRYCILDFEATGANAQTDFITQVGQISCQYNDMKGRLEVVNDFSSFVRSPIPITPFISKLTNITNDQIILAPSFNNISERVFQMLQGTTVITQAGYEFDFPLLEKECTLHNLILPAFKRIDIKALFTYLHPEEKGIVSTHALISYYQLDVSTFQRHHALGDCYIIMLIFECIIAECKARNINHIDVQNLVVKKYKI